MPQESNTPFHSGQSFDQLITKSDILRGLYESNFDEASVIQSESIPKILQKDENGHYKSLIAQSQNGTGKTLSFVTGMLERIDINTPHLQAICLFATRELVIQTYEDYIRKLTKYYTIATSVLIRDPPIHFDEEKAQLILSTPMQFNDYMDKLNLATVRVLVIDEADYVLQNKTFTSFFNTIFGRLTQHNTQILLFSATINQQLHDFIGNYIDPNDLNKIIVEKNLQFTPTNKHFYIAVKNDDEKLDIVKKIFKSLESSHTFIFVNTKKFAEDLYNTLKELHYESQYFSNTLRRAQRDSIIKDFKDGAINVLICTDMISRGLDIPSARTVINFDMPVTKKGGIAIDTYMHRQGRTGRFEKNGVVINFLNENQAGFVTKIEKEYNLQLEPFTNDDEGIAKLFEEIEKTARKVKDTSDNENGNNE